MNTDIIEKFDMLPRGAGVLCAVSGGADSMCLLHFLWTNAERYGITVSAAHFDHQLRGLESARDRTFVRDWCRERGIACFVGFGKVREYSEKNGLGLEEAARILRYDFLEKTADEQGLDRIATAHNADDNAETMLLNLARGSGTAGLAGVPPVRGRVVRPLLGVTRSEILSYLAENGVEHVEDSTNASDDYARNRIRHAVMPVMREINPSFSENALRAALLLREDGEYLTSLAEDFVSEKGEGGALPAEKLLALPRPAAARAVRLMSGRALSKEHTDAVLRLAASGAGCADIPGMRVTAERGRLIFGGSEHAPLEERPLLVPGRTPISEAGLAAETAIIENCKEINSSFSTFFFKYENICGNIFCTCRRDGDRVRLAGRGCTKTLKDLFRESGMTQAMRDLTPVLRDEIGIIAVYGFGIAERCAARPGDRVLRVNIEKDGETDNVG
jgi:tRNA(Ile)-lysidine synthase